MCVDYLAVIKRFKLTFPVYYFTKALSCSPCILTPWYQGLCPHWQCAVWFTLMMHPFCLLLLINLYLPFAVLPEPSIMMDSFLPHSLHLPVPNPLIINPDFSVSFKSLHFANFLLLFLVVLLNLILLSNCRSSCFSFWVHYFILFYSPSIFRGWCTPTSSSAPGQGPSSSPSPRNRRWGWDQLPYTPGQPAHHGQLILPVRSSLPSFHHNTPMLPMW